MSYLQIIQRLEEMLRMALEIIDKQTVILHQHGIETDDRKLETARQKFQNDMEEWL